MTSLLEIISDIALKKVEKDLDSYDLDECDEEEEKKLRETIREALLQTQKQ